MRRTLLTLALSVAVAAPAAAQKLTLDFHDGRVTVDAAAVPVRTILSEWAKLGGTKVIGAERIAGAPLTVKLVDVPESQALEVILRSVAGYMAAPRSTGTGASIYDRILVMATSATPAPAVARPAPQNNNGMAGTQRFVPPRREQPAEEDQNQEEEDPNPPNPPVFTFPQPGQGAFQPGQFGNVAQPNGQAITVNPSGGAPMTVSPAAPSVPGYQPPIGVSTPGMVTPGTIAPSAPPPTVTQPTSMIRPPGREQ